LRVAELEIIIDIFALVIVQNLEKNTSNKNYSLTGSILLSASLILLSVACNPTRYVPEEDTLLDENHVIISRENIKKSDLSPYIKQKPNKTIFGTKFHLGLYNLSNLEKQKWPHSWLREIGEEPVIFDAYATEKSRQQIESYIFSKGYFDSRVMETIETANRKSKVYYNVDLKPPYTIKELHFDFADSTINRLFIFDSVNCLIERGKPYDVDILQAEKLRFEKYIRDKGFYAFSGEYVSFSVDSSLGNRQVIIDYSVGSFQQGGQGNRTTEVPHSIYDIRNVYIHPNFIPKDALEGGDEYISNLDTTFINGYYFIAPKGRPPIKSDLILQAVYLKPGSIYNVTNTEQTQSHLLSLKTFRLVNIYYTDVPKAEGHTLDCNIQLTLLSQQSFKVELEGTNSAGNLGGALNFIYQHKNLFRGAELFNLKLKGAYEALSQQNTDLQSSQEYSVETSLRLPRFFLPFLEKESFIKKYNPSTNLLGAFNYQSLPFYTRTMANATFGYNWYGNAFTTHIVNPVQLNRVKLISIDSAFYEKIEASSYLAYSYRSVMILGGNYSFIFNNQKLKSARDYWFVRVNAEAAGNMLGLLSRVADFEKVEGSYNIFKQPFAQYIRADVDFRYNVILNDAGSVVYRGFVGAGIPYGNSKAIPFEKQYFGGGANGIRAWQVRTLGPGSYVPGDSTFLNQTADIKIEANIEYRFKLFWVLEGALFLDAGNIWSARNDPARPGAQFSINKFYKDMAVGSGLGLRFDFDFVLFRADLGVKLRDPWEQSGSKWIIMNRPYSFRDDFTLVLAIGYPF
jgi:outer membrane protein assembly factor BamA